MCYLCFTPGLSPQSGAVRCLSADWARCRLLTAGESLELLDFDAGELLIDAQVQSQAFKGHYFISIS